MIKMSEEARAARNAYARSWYRKNKEHVRNYRKEQRKNNVEQYRAREQKYIEETESILMKSPKNGERKIPIKLCNIKSTILKRRRKS